MVALPCRKDERMNMEDKNIKDLFDSFMYAYLHAPIASFHLNGTARKDIPKVHLKTADIEKQKLSLHKFYVDDLPLDISRLLLPDTPLWKQGCDFGISDSKTVYVRLNEKHEPDGFCVVPGNECGGEDMNEKSLEFAKKRIASGDCGGMENDKFEHMNEVNFRLMADSIQFNECVKVSDNLWEVEFLVKGTDKSVKLSVKYNPDAEFDYISIKRCCCDGTLCFFKDLCEEILEKILSGKSAYTPKMPKDRENYDIFFEVGNFVFAEEYGEQFAPEDKPWMKCRFTAMLPVKCDFVRRTS